MFERGLQTLSLFRGPMYEVITSKDETPHLFKLFSQARAWCNSYALIERVKGREFWAEVRTLQGDVVYTVTSEQNNP